MVLPMHAVCIGVYQQIGKPAGPETNARLGALHCAGKTPEKVPARSSQFLLTTSRGAVRTYTEKLVIVQ